MVTRMGSKRRHDIMEARLSGDADVTYIERSIEGYAWACDGCGLLWEKKWHAEKCESRGHVKSFDQRYGGYVENGVWRGGKAYTRFAIGRV